MTNNVEQPSRWPSRSANDITSPKLFVTLACMFSTLSAVSVVLHVIDVRKHGAWDWRLVAVGLVVATVLPAVTVLGGYRQIKKVLLVTGSSPLVLEAIQDWGSRILAFAYLALTIVLTNTLSH